METEQRHMGSSSIRNMPAAPLERRDARSRDALLRRVEASFREMPGLSLTLAQAKRLFAVSQDACERLLSALIQAGFLARSSRGLYRRRDDIP